MNDISERGVGRIFLLGKGEGDAAEVDVCFFEGEWPRKLSFNLNKALFSWSSRAEVSVDELHLDLRAPSLSKTFAAGLPSSGVGEGDASSP